MRRVLAVVAGGLVLTMTMPASSAPNSGRTGLGVRLADAPSKLANDPRARSYIIDHLPPGSHITRHVEVSNDTGAPAHIVLYADAASVAHGSFLPAPNATPNDLTRWTT